MLSTVRSFPTLHAYPSGFRDTGCASGVIDLSAAVDVYSDWVDACDAVAKEDGEERAGEHAPSRPAAGRAARRGDGDEDDVDDLIDDADADEDGMGGYGGEGIADDEY